MARKTISIEVLRNQINEMLKISTREPSMRFGFIGVLESVLHDTGNYRGFRYLTSEEVPAKQEPGVIRGETNVFPDDSRRHYF
jgi:hypothetical protein